MDELRDITTLEMIMRAFACDAALAGTIATKARIQDHAAHAVIVEGDSVFNHVYLMIAGRARMLAYAIDGRLIAVEDYDPGDFFGENGLFETQTAPHDIAAIQPARTGAFPHAQFVTLMSMYNCIALAVSKRLVTRLSLITRRMVEGATLSANGRIHAELLRQARASETMTIRPAPVLSAFALLVHSTRETVSRAISNLEKRGIIQRDEQSLRVVAPHRLEELIF
jgi:CRP-like cAMP-binding protein